jgi:hypothetical protein
MCFALSTAGCGCTSFECHHLLTRRVNSQEILKTKLSFSWHIINMIKREALFESIQTALERWRIPWQRKFLPCRWRAWQPSNHLT